MAGELDLAASLKRKQGFDNLRTMASTNSTTDVQGESSSNDALMVQNLDGSDDPGRRAYNDEFYLRYYVGHKGEYGHEFMVSSVIPSSGKVVAKYNELTDFVFLSIARSSS